MQLFLYILIGLLAGYLLGRLQYGKKNAPPLADPDTQKELSDKGRKAVQKRNDERKVRILARAREQERIANNDVENLLSVSDATARRYLDELEKEGKLTQVGNSGRDVYYTPNS